LHDLPGLKLTAICRRSPEVKKQAETWGVRGYTRWHELLEDPDVEAVIAVTTPNLHASIAEACVRVRKPLLLEKPLSIDVSSASDIVERFTAACLPLTVAQTLRYNAVISGLRREYSRVGELFFFSANHRLESSQHPWMTDPLLAGGGVILHTAVHLFDALRFITGKEIRRVRAEMVQRHNPNLEDLFMALVEMEDGTPGTVDASKVGPARTGRYEFLGAGGQLQGDQIHGRLEFIQGKDLQSLPVAEPVSTIVPLLRDWETYLRGNGTNPIPGEEGLAAIRICEACRKSAIENRSVDV
jgi:predicted dehydrogenase